VVAVSVAGAGDRVLRVGVSHPSGKQDVDRRQTPRPVNLSPFHGIALHAYVPADCGSGLSACR